LKNRISIEITGDERVKARKGRMSKTNGVMGMIWVLSLGRQSLLENRPKGVSGVEGEGEVGVEAGSELDREATGLLPGC
jgi:hypothetical protein